MMSTIASSEPNAKKICGIWHNNPSENTFSLFWDMAPCNTFRHLSTLNLLPQSKLFVDVTETITQLQFKCIVSVSEY